MDTPYRANSEVSCGVQNQMSFFKLLISAKFKSFVNYTEG